MHSMQYLALSIAISTISIFAQKTDKPDKGDKDSKTTSAPCYDFTSNPNYLIEADRVYYVSCVERIWDYAPTNTNVLTDTEITETSHEGTWLYGNGKDRIGRQYYKALFREFNDQCFTDETERGIKWDHLGSVGPAIRAIVGETIKVFFLNQCTIPSSMHPHGLLYDKLSEGAPYLDGDESTGDIVEPGNGWVYIWKTREGNVDAGASSKMWLYHSHVDEVDDIITGLIGPIIITRAGSETSDEDLMPNDVEREYVTFFMMYDENKSLMFDKNVNEFLTFDEYTTADQIGNLLYFDPDFYESNLMHSINGYLFGNLEDLTCTGDERVRWHTASFGNEKDGPHSPHWHGNIATTSYGENTDAVVLISGTTSTVTMTVDAMGIWMFHCHVFDHIEAGMVTTYTAEAGVPGSDDGSPLIDVDDGIDDAGSDNGSGGQNDGGDGDDDDAGNDDDAGKPDKGNKPTRGNKDGDGGETASMNNNNDDGNDAYDDDDDADSKGKGEDSEKSEQKSKKSSKKSKPSRKGRKRSRRWGGN